MRLCTGVPLLFMTNLGADPSQELQEVANSIVGAEAYHQLAMGQGQTQPALDMLHASARTGEHLDSTVTPAFVSTHVACCAFWSGKGAICLLQKGVHHARQQLCVCCAHGRALDLLQGSACVGLVRPAHLAITCCVSVSS